MENLYPYILELSQTYGLLFWLSLVLAVCLVLLLLFALVRAIVRKSKAKRAATAVAAPKAPVEKMKSETAKAPANTNALIEALLAAKRSDDALMQLLEQAGMANLLSLAENYARFAPPVADAVKKSVKKWGWLRSYLRVNKQFSVADWKLLWAAFADESLFPALVELLGDRREGVALAAAEFLSDMQDARLLPYLIGALYQPKQYLPARVAEVLLAYGEEAAFLLLCFLGDGDQGQKALFLDILAQFGNKCPVNAVAAYLNDPAEDIRKAAAEALGAIGGKDAVGPLCAALSDSSWQVRAASAKALGACGDQSALPYLQDLVEDEAFWVRANVQETLSILAG